MKVQVGALPLLLAAALGLRGLPCRAAGPPTEPILRIETGMHSGAISQASTDVEDRYLATGSRDKTVRVWELSTGRLVQILRPPIGAGNEGKIFAAAMSPDGKTVACGGWTGYDGQGSDSIYIFDRETGSMRRRITGLPDVVQRLAYSKDGRFLAATIGWNGLRVYRASDYALAAEDKNYSANSYVSGFDHAGRLATASYDGYIRLYDAAFKLLAKERAPGGNEPYSLSFSPDGDKLAVGFADSAKVAVVSGRNLAPLFFPDVTGVDNGALSNVAWSADGSSLYAGGTYDAQGMSPIRKWSGAGQGSYADLPASLDNIASILPLRAGGLVFGSGDPSFGVFDRNDQKSLFKGPAIADFRGMGEHFRMSADGAVVQFGYALGGKSPARFSVASRGLELDPGSATALLPPMLSGGALNITAWEDNRAPKLNGKRLLLERSETSRSLAVTPSLEAFLLGTDRRLRLFNKNGKETWDVPVPGVAWSVNISGNGNLAVAAYADGTIRWHSMKDGKELLAFFPHNDKKRWVLWTPSGYYDASPGGEDLIGWHVNNGPDQAADFFPASKFRATYYRPDVIAKILEALDEGEALRLANAESGRKERQADLQKQIPPVVRILSPSDGAAAAAPQITLRYSVRSPSGEPVTAVRVLVDGRPIDSTRGMKVAAKTSEPGAQELTVTVPEKDCEVSVIAENRFAASEPATIRIKWTGKPSEEFVIKPKLYLLAVGVGNYINAAEIPKLELAAKDAKDFAQAMLAQKGGLYRDVVVKVLTDEAATRDEVVDGLDWIQKETTSKDVAMVFLAGHGVNDSNGVYYYLPVNAHPEKLKRTGVVFSDIKNTLNSIAGKALFFVDTCHAGNVMGKRRALPDLTGMINELTSAENGAIVFASSSGSQYALESAAWGNGAFTKALVEGLGGKADYGGKGRVTVNMLDLYLSERVKELTKGRQTPTTTKPQTVPDFPVAVSRR